MIPHHRNRRLLQLIRSGNAQGKFQPESDICKCQETQMSNFFHHSLDGCSRTTRAGCISPGVGILSMFVVLLFQKRLSSVRWSCEFLCLSQCAMYSWKLYLKQDVFLGVLLEAGCLPVRWQSEVRYLPESLKSVNKQTLILYKHDFSLPNRPIGSGLLRAPAICWTQVLNFLFQFTSTGNIFPYYTPTH